MQTKKYYCRVTWTRNM